MAKMVGKIKVVRALAHWRIGIIHGLESLEIRGIIHAVAVQALFSYHSIFLLFDTKMAMAEFGELRRNIPGTTRNDVEERT
jgi:hypothetical protein